VCAKERGIDGAGGNACEYRELMSGKCPRQAANDAGLIGATRTATAKDERC
jgi:hypothetical protein